MFKIQIPSGMNTLRVRIDRFPKSAEEFQKEILDPANITLPELPAGEYYNYDPATGELGVVHPSKNGTSSGTKSVHDGPRRIAKGLGFRRTKLAKVAQCQ